MLRSVEERVEDYYKARLSEYGVRIYGKAEDVNEPISRSLREAYSKQGGDGANYPDIKLMLEDGYRRAIPVMIEAKGLPGRLEKLDKSGNVVGVRFHRKDGKVGEDGEPVYRKGDPDYSVVSRYAVNGALHYGKAILDYSGEYDEVIVVGLNGTRLDADGFVENPEHKAYYVSKANGCVPKHIPQLDGDIALFSPSNVPKLYEILDRLSLSYDEARRMEEEARAGVEDKVRAIRRYLDDDPVCGRSLGPNERLYMLIGLAVAGMKTPGVSPLRADCLHGDNSPDDNDGRVVLGKIRAHLSYNGCSLANVSMAMRLLEPVFSKESLWNPVNDESAIKRVFGRVAKDIVPLLEDAPFVRSDSPLVVALTDWANADADIVPTPRCAAALMARLARVGRDSTVWVPSMGSGSLFASAMDLMISDAAENIQDSAELASKIGHIKERQVAGSEVRDESYALALLNMVLLGNCAAQIVNGDDLGDVAPERFDPDVVLMSPPYDGPGRGLSSVYEALGKMGDGYACILARENAGSGLAADYAKDILKGNTLVASIRMPRRLLAGEADSQAAIFLFKSNRPHEKDDLVSFVDFSDDGYCRQSRRKSVEGASLRDAGDAAARYDELVARLTGKEAATSFYTEENGLLVRDTITLNGDDWTYGQHMGIDFNPSHEDFVRTVAEYLSWKLGAMVKGEGVYCG